MQKNFIIKLILCLIIFSFFITNFEIVKSENINNLESLNIPSNTKTEPSISFTIIVLPDTQYYSSSYPYIFTNQTQWIVANRQKLNIVYVGHVGDIVNNALSFTQWRRANTSMSYLEDPTTTGLSDGIPYSVVRGNHDIGRLFDKYFGITRFNEKSYYGGHYSDNNQNNYVLFNVGDFQYISISLDYNPDIDELNWTKHILQTYSDRRAIIISHSILDNPAGDWTIPGLNIYNAVKDYSNVFLMLCGHEHFEARRKDTYKGHTIYTLLADYQDCPKGGNGWLRIIEVYPETNIIKVETYSPYLNKYKNDLNSDFILYYTQSENQPAPIINGPNNGIPCKVINYYFTAEDPQGDKLYYFINWGDGSTTGWIGPYLSEELISKSHTWLKKGIFTIKAKVMDTFFHESNWSTIDLNMTKTKTYIWNLKMQIKIINYQHFAFF